MYVVLCLCIVTVFELRDLAFSYAGSLTLIARALRCHIHMSSQRYWDSRLLVCTRDQKIAEWDSSVIPRLSEKAMTAFVISDSNGCYAPNAVF